MREFDAEKLEKAIIYVRRMADGRVPYSNQPMEDEILNNPNVIRCMYFVADVLREVQANKGIVGGRSGRSASARKQAAYPYEVLEGFRYQEDLPVSRVLEQFRALAGDPEVRMVSAASVNKWLAENGYLTRTQIGASGQTGWTSTDRGEAIGIHAELVDSMNGRQYIRLTYTRPAQEFLAAHYREIAEDTSGRRGRAEGAEAGTMEQSGSSARDNSDLPPGWDYVK